MEVTEKTRHVPKIVDLETRTSHGIVTAQVEDDKVVYYRVQAGFGYDKTPILVSDANIDSLIEGLTAVRARARHLAHQHQQNS